MTCKWIAETIGIRYKMKSLLSLPFNFRMQKALTLLRTACYSNTRSNPFVIFSISIGMCSSGYSDLTHSTWIVEACVPMTVGIFSAFGLMCPIEMCKLMACGNSTLAIPSPFPSLGTIRIATSTAFISLFVCCGSCGCFLPVDVLNFSRCLNFHLLLLLFAYSSCRCPCTCWEQTCRCARCVCERTFSSVC